MRGLIYSANTQKVTLNRKSTQSLLCAQFPRTTRMLKCPVPTALHSRSQSGRNISVPRAAVMSPRSMIEVITIYGILCLQYKEAPRMASLRFTDVQDRPTEFLDFTSLTLNEFQQLVPPFEAAFQAHTAAWRLDGKPRTARQFSVYKNCPLPTPEDRLFFLLTYLKTYSLQVVQGRLFGMGQSKAHQWIHVLLPALLAALRALGDAPTRSLTALAQRLGVSETDAATVVAPLAEELVPLTAAPAVVPASPLVPMTERNGVLSAPKTLLHRPHVRGYPETFS